MKKVLICGYYGANNRGDELILKVLTEYLREKDVQVTVLSLDPAATAREYGVRAAKFSSSLKKGVGRFSCELLRADAFILGGGGLFEDYGKHFRVVLFYGMRVLLAGIMGKKIAYFALGVGNVELERSKRLINFVTRKVDTISVRDRGSKVALEEMGVRRPIAVCADPVFTISPAAPAARCGNNEKRARVGISVLPYDEQLMFSNGTDEKIEKTIEQFCDYLLERHFDVTFVPMKKGTDDRFIEKIIDRGNFKGKVSVLDSSLGHQDFMAGYALCDVIIGMRLHSVILAAILGIPFIPVCYHSKVTNTVGSLGQEDLAIMLEALDGSELISKFELLLADYNKRKKDLAARVYDLRADAFKALRLLDNLI